MRIISLKTIMVLLLTAVFIAPAIAAQVRQLG